MIRPAIEGAIHEEPAKPLDAIVATSPRDRHARIGRDSCRARPLGRGLDVLSGTPKPPQYKDKGAAENQHARSQHCRRPENLDGLGERGLEQRPHDEAKQERCPGQSGQIEQHAQRAACRKLGKANRAAGRTDSRGHHGHHRKGGNRLWAQCRPADQERSDSQEKRDGQDVGEYHGPAKRHGGGEMGRQKPRSDVNPQHGKAAKQDGHARTSGNAEKHRRYERSAFLGVVGGLRRDDAGNRAVAEARLPLLRPEASA